jgi:hypothetical protein
VNAVHQPGEQYSGPAQLIASDDQALEVQVQLRGHVEPIDGRFHWYGRIARNDAVGEQHRSGSTVAVRTPYGTAAGRISDVDPWGRFRVTGLGTPPF